MKKCAAGIACDEVPRVRLLVLSLSQGDLSGIGA
jgi:hypothetical protein